MYAPKIDVWISKSESRQKGRVTASARTTGVPSCIFLTVTDKIELTSGCHKAIDGTKGAARVLMNIK